MAKSKYEKLARLMLAMLDQIQKHSEQVAKQLNSVQLFFYEHHDPLNYLAHLPSECKLSSDEDRVFIRPLSKPTNQALNCESLR